MPSSARGKLQWHAGRAWCQGTAVQRHMESEIGHRLLLTIAHVAEAVPQCCMVTTAAFIMKYCSNNRQGMLSSVKTTRQTEAAVQPQHRSGSHFRAVNADCRSVQVSKGPPALMYPAQAWCCAGIAC